MLILNVGDGHITGQNPIARIDNLVVVQFDKWIEIVTIANKFDCPIVCTGDIFNVPILANSLLVIFGDIINNLKHPLYFVWGNHDVLYHSVEMYKRTSLGVMVHNNDKIRHISEFEKDYGIAWDYCDWNEPIKTTGSKLLLIHQAIVNTKMIGGKNSWIADDLEFSRNVTDPELINYELIVCGHWHKRYRFKHKNITVVNPGPVLRRTIEDTDEPTVQLINLDTKLRRIIKLKSVKPTELVISNQHLEENVHKIKADIVEFVKALKNKRIKYKSSFLDNLIMLLDNHEIDKPIENLLRELIVNLIEVKGRKESGIKNG